MPRPIAQMTAIDALVDARRTRRVRKRHRGDRSRAGEVRAPQHGADQKKFAEPVAVSSTTPTDFPLRPLRAASYSLPVLLRPTPAPCSAQEGMYGLSGHVARVSRDGKCRNLRTLNNQHFHSTLCILWITRRGSSRSDPPRGPGWVGPDRIGHTVPAWSRRSRGVLAATLRGGERRRQTVLLLLDITLLIVHWT